MASTFEFPRGFLWGAATSAYQVEGSPLADGAGVSNWHRFTRTRGLVEGGQNGDVACDHYNRYLEDVGLLSSLGLNAYRFSVSWSRILPEGRGRVNQKGLDFYRRLVDALGEAGIAPLVTLFHWDLPAALDDRGGWLNPDIADWFADYARVLYGALDGSVSKWVTLNEPWVVTDGGYLHGKLAPGHRSLHETPIAAHNLLRAHGSAVSAYRAEGKHEIGLVVNLEPKYAASPDPLDVSATARAEAYMNRQFLDPVFFGRSPGEMATIFGEAWPAFRERDFDQIRVPIDFLGVNYYTRTVNRDDPSRWPVGAAPVHQPRSTYTETGWEVYPRGLTETLLWVKSRYGDVPLYVTENGAAFYDPPTPDGGRVRDPLRVSYLRAHIRAAHEAISKGVDLRGYCAWSLLDNFEWSLGYAKRFGIVHVDYATQVRTPKDSGRFYAEVARTNGTALEGDDDAG